MAYQKLQAGRAWAVNKSDNTDIPNIGIAGPTGATTTGSATQLIDSSATFLTSGVKLNMIVVNTTDNTQAVDIVADKFNKDCGCDERRDSLNRLFPYKK